MKTRMTDVLRYIKKIAIQQAGIMAQQGHFVMSRNKAFAT
jgi:hypothetical protein